jgi:hypothetical protein
MTFKEMVEKIKEQEQKAKESIQNTMHNIACIFSREKK